MTPENKKAILRFRRVIAEKRYLQGDWNQTIKGKEYVCLAAAWGTPGTIKSTKDCPLTLFPKWVFDLMPVLDDGVSKEYIPWLFQSFADRSEKMAGFSRKQWEGIQSYFLSGVIITSLCMSIEDQVSLPDKWWPFQHLCLEAQDAVRSRNTNNALLQANKVVAMAKRFRAVASSTTLSKVMSANAATHYRKMAKLALRTATVIKHAANLNVEGALSFAMGNLSNRSEELRQAAYLQLAADFFQSVDRSMEKM